MITASDRKQLGALIAIVKPANSLAARLETLTDEQRAAYEKYRDRMSAWIEKLKAHRPDDDDPDAYLYDRTLETKFGEPKLRRDVRIALYGPDRLIPITASEDEAARIYVDFCDEQ